MIFQHAEMAQKLWQFIIRENGQLIYVAQRAPLLAAECSAQVGHANLGAFVKAYFLPPKTGSIAKRGEMLDQQQGQSNRAPGSFFDDMRELSIEPFQQH